MFSDDRLLEVWARVWELPPAERAHAARAYAADETEAATLLALLAEDGAADMSPSPRDVAAALWEVALPRDLGDWAGRRLTPRLQLGELAGAGGQGFVYRGNDLASLQRLAVKVLPMRDASSFAAMRRELRAAAMLAAPRTVGVVAMDRHGDALWFAMPWIDGEPMGVGEVWPWERVRRAVAALLGSLRHIHRHNWLHGDIKPSNVLVAADGLPHLLDLGLAGRHRVGVALEGTLGWISPRRLLGAPPSPADDLYALGRLANAALDAGQRQVAETWSEAIAEASAWTSDHGVRRARTAGGQGVPDEARSAIDLLLEMGLPRHRPLAAAMDQLAQLLYAPESARQHVFACLPDDNAARDAAALATLFDSRDPSARLVAPPLVDLARRSHGTRQGVADVLARWEASGVGGFAACRYELAPLEAREVWAGDDAWLLRQGPAWRDEDGASRRLLDALRIEPRGQSLLALARVARVQTEEASRALAGLTAKGWVCEAAEGQWKLLAWPSDLPVPDGHIARRLHLHWAAVLRPLPTAWQHAVGAGLTVRSILRAAIRAARKAAAYGRNAAAVKCLDAALALVWTEPNPGDLPVVEALVLRTQWACTAWDGWATMPASLALLDEFVPLVPAVSHLAAAIRERSRALRGGEAFPCVESAGASCPEVDVSLAKIEAAAKLHEACDVGGEVLEQAIAEARLKLPPGALLPGGLDLRLAYRQHRFEDAARLYELQATRAGRTREGASSWFSAAEHWLFAQRGSDMRRCHLAALEAAPPCDVPLVAVTYVAQERVLEYSQGGAPRRDDSMPALELHTLELRVHSVPLLREATYAWRRGDADGARALAGRAVHATRTHSRPGLNELIETFALFLDPTAEIEAFDPHLQLARRSAFPRSALQVFALARARIGASIDLEPTLRERWVAGARAPLPAFRFEVLSLQECLKCLVEGCAPEA